MTAKAKHKPIKERIREALADGEIGNYYWLMRKVFPRKAYPNAWRHAVQGGPPGCAMAFSRALNEMLRAQDMYECSHMNVRFNSERSFRLARKKP